MINYFISSTFRDMQSERDVLQNNILPEIRRYAAVRGHDFFLTDLRWGIDTSCMDVNDSMKKILSICMSEIDYCHPHMIVLLGDCYGSVPDEDIIESFLHTPQGEIFSAESIKRKSITEMEIIHGLFHHTSHGNFTICMRNSLPKEEMKEDIIPVFFEMEQHNTEKLYRLKKMLMEKFPENILQYSAKWDKNTNTVTGLEEFTKQLIHRLTKQIDAGISDPITHESAQHNADKLFVESKSKTVIGRESYLHDIHDFIQSPDEAYLILTGISGVGKSCLMAKIAKEYSDNTVIAIFCGNSPYIKTDYDLMRNLIYRLCLILRANYSNHVGTNSISKLKELAQILIDRVCANGNLLILIDSLDALQSDEDELNFLPDIKIATKCKIIVSTNNNIRKRHFYDRSVRTVYLDNLEDGELSEMIDKQLSFIRKTLPNNTKDLLLKKVAYHTPLYASMIFGRISSLNQLDYQEISKFSVKTGIDTAVSLYLYIEAEIDHLPETESELAKYMADGCNYSIQFLFRKTVLQVLCLFSDGIRFEDIIGISMELGERITFLDLKVYLNYLHTMVHISQDNRVSFLHNLISDAFKKEFADITKPIYEAANRYFKKISNEDNMKSLAFIRISYCCEDYEAIAMYLSNLYLNEEKMLLCDDKSANLLNTAMTSLRNVFNGIKDGKEALDFIKKIINSISEDNVNQIYGLCCAFLFTFDTFFSNLTIANKASTIMQLLYDKCIRVLYPHRNENLFFLRAVYICCEQKGIRATEYDEQMQSYFEFNRYCDEMYSSINGDFKYRIDIINDLSLSFSKLAALYCQRNWRYALELYDKAIEIVKLPYGNASINSKLCYRMHTAYCEKASCIINKAVQNKHIGWPIDNEMSGLLDESLSMILMAIEYYKNDNIPRYKDLAYCYLRLADCARVKGIEFEEKRYTMDMIEYAQLAYNENHNIIMYDLIRNGEFRLGYHEQIELMDQYHLQKAFDMTLELQQELDTPMAQKILHYAGGRLLMLHSKQLIDDFDEYKDCNEISEKCLASVNAFIPIMEVLLIYDDGQDCYHALIDIFRITMKNIQIQRDLAVNALERHDYQSALQKAMYAYDLLKAMKGQFDFKKWLINMLDISHLLSVCVHNSRSHAIYTNDHDITQEKCNFMAIKANCELYYCILYYKMLFPHDELLENYNRIFNSYVGNFYYALFGWIAFVADNVSDESKINRFWLYVDKIIFSISNSPTAYFDVIGSKEVIGLTNNYIGIVGKYLYEHFQDERVQKLLYFNTLLEDITLEYAYQQMDYKCVEKIIENGYDRYLELSTLYIIRKHDRGEFYRRVNELKFICLLRHITLISQDWLRQITGSLFVQESATLFRKILSTQNSTSSDDPRNHSGRSVYKFLSD